MRILIQNRSRINREKILFMIKTNLEDKSKMQISMNKQNKKVIDKLKNNRVSMLR